MRFLRRFGGQEAEATEPPVTPPTMRIAGPDTLILASAECPICGVVFEPLPRQAGKRKCPACGTSVYVARVDDVGYIVREAAAAPDPAVPDEEYARARDRLFSNKDGTPLRAVNRRILRRWASLGLWVEIEGNGDCRTCRNGIGRRYPANDAPLLPRADCASRPNRICVCRYVVRMP